MNITVNSYRIGDTSDHIAISIPLPIQCPTCTNSPQPNVLDAYHLSISDRLELYVLYFCTKCKKCFMCKYYVTGGLSYDRYALEVEQYPPSRHLTSFSDNISSLSSRFVSIYQQAEQAEKAGLDEICGMGYRKALEFLIKDYAIKYNSEKAEKISKDNLMPCINSYISDNDIKTLASRCTWLGNDEAHYIRKQTDYNIHDLKAFINSMITYIDFKLTVEKASLIEPK